MTRDEHKAALYNRLTPVTVYHAECDCCHWSGNDTSRKDLADDLYLNGWRVVGGNIRCPVCIKERRNPS